MDRYRHLWIPKKTARGQGSKTEYKIVKNWTPRVTKALEILPNEQGISKQNEQSCAHVGKGTSSKIPKSSAVRRRERNVTISEVNLSNIGPSNDNIISLLSTDGETSYGDPVKGSANSNEESRPSEDRPSSIILSRIQEDKEGDILKGRMKGLLSRLGGRSHEESNRNSTSEKVEEWSRVKDGFSNKEGLKQGKSTDGDFMQEFVDFDSKDIHRSDTEENTHLGQSKMSVSSLQKLHGLSKSAIPPGSNHKDEVNTPLTVKTTPLPIQTTSRKRRRQKLVMPRTKRKKNSADHGETQSQVEEEDYAVKLWCPKYIKRTRKDLSELDVCMSIYDKFLREALEETDDIVVQEALVEHWKQTQKRMLSKIKDVHLMNALEKRYKQEKKKAGNQRKKLMSDLSALRRSNGEYQTTLAIASQAKQMEKRNALREEILSKTRELRPLMSRILTQTQ